jgi:hypothetical protein
MTLSCEKGSGSFYRGIVLLKYFDWTASNRTPCDQKSSNLFSTKKSFDRKVIRPKAFSARGRLTNSSFDWQFIWPKAFFEKGYLTERSLTDLVKRSLNSGETKQNETEKITRSRNKTKRKATRQLGKKPVDMSVYFFLETKRNS